MNAPRSSALQADINVTPLVDVCLVLLIIFMVVTPILVHGVPVQLPETKNAAAAGDVARQLAVTVKDDGTVYIDGIVLRHEQVAAELQRLHAAHPNRPVVVRGDKRVQYGAVVEVLDACRGAGFENVGLISAQRN